MTCCNISFRMPYFISWPKTPIFCSSSLPRFVSTILLVHWFLFLNQSLLHTSFFVLSSLYLRNIFSTSVVSAQAPPARTLRHISISQQTYFKNWKLELFALQILIYVWVDSQASLCKVEMCIINLNARCLLSVFSPERTRITLRMRAWTWDHFLNVVQI